MKERSLRVRCVICLVKFERDEVIKTLPCFHFYHSICIDRVRGRTGCRPHRSRRTLLQWLQKDKTCPVCKTALES